MAFIILFLLELHIVLLHHLIILILLHLLYERNLIVAKIQTANMQCCGQDIDKETADECAIEINYLPDAHFHQGYG